MTLHGDVGGRFRGVAYAGSLQNATYGDAFDVMRDIIVTSAKQVGKSTMMTFRFKGGYGPYSVKVERALSEKSKPSHAPCLLKYFTEDYTIDVFVDVGELYYTGRRKNEKGKWESVKLPYIFYVTVTDEMTGASRTASLICDW